MAEIRHKRGKEAPGPKGKKILMKRHAGLLHLVFMNSSIAEIWPYNGARLIAQTGQDRDRVSMNREEITVLLRRWREGDRDAESELFRELMPRMREIADRCLRRERPNHTLHRDDLINTVYFRLFKAKSIDWQDRGHFLAIATRMMRRYLIEYARKRPKAIHLPIDGLPEGLFAGRSRVDVAIAVDEQLDEMEKEFPRRCNVVILMAYLGFNPQETAKELGISQRTAEREWFEGRKWLFEKLSKKQCKAAQKTTM